MYVLVKVDELRHTKPDTQVAFQAGPAGGIWTRCDEMSGEDNGGTSVHDSHGSLWVRACEPSQLDAHWFGVKADGATDDAPALQRAIDSLPASGGVVRLPTGKMRCASHLRISQPYITIQGANMGLRSKHFEPGGEIGVGSLLLFDPGVDGVVIQAGDEDEHAPQPRLGGITLRDLGIAGAGRGAGQCGVVVRPAKGREWGSTDALMLDHLYIIDCEWCAYLQHCDASIIRDCWFSECANGLHLDRCIYTVVTGTCVADNSHTGVRIDQGKGNEIASGVFVRNEIALDLRDTKQMRVNGGIFATDDGGGSRHDLSLIRAQGLTELIVSAASFTAEDSHIQAAIQCSRETLLEHAACQTSGVLEQLINVMPIPA